MGRGKQKVGYPFRMIILNFPINKLIIIFEYGKIN